MTDDALLPLDAVRGKTPGRSAKGAPVAAPSQPVARVAVDTPLPHLDRLFDYLVPEQFHDSAVPGVRVRVRFAGKLVDGFLLGRAERSEHEGRLTPLERVVSAEPVLTEEVAGLARAVADRYAGTLADVLRLAVPPRHAKVEAEPRPETPEPRPETPEPASAQPEGSPSSDAQPDPALLPDAAPEETTGAWADYPMGPSFLDALEHGRAPRAVWSALPGTAWTGPMAQAVAATLAGGRGAVVVVPDGKDVELLDQALLAHLGPGRHVALTAGLGPSERYRRWLKVLRGEVRAVAGTRAAMFAPVHELGLVAIWDDGDDLHAERLAPYPHAREVLALRAHRTGAAMLIGSHGRTAEATQLIASGWARPILARRETIRAVAPRVRPAGEDAELAKDQAARAARLPSIAWRVLKEGLEHGPVLIQVPRRGYVPVIACQNCREPARCALPPTRSVPASGPGESGPQASMEGMMLEPPARALTDLVCHGPLALRSGHAAPYCRWCGRVDAAWRCPSCGGGRVRAVVIGARRTAEELGRAFPSTRVKTSGRDGVLATVGGKPALVVATPGAEPVAEGGYAAAVLLDGWALLGRADLRAAEEALRRWMNAAALLRPAAELVVLADGALPVVQALLRWDPVTHAERELAERAELGFPPAVRMATLTGAPAAVRQVLEEVRLPPSAQVLGPVPVGDGGQERAMVRVPRPDGAALAAALKGASGVRAARKAPDIVRVSVDPLDLI
ncbi:primosomal protein N' [Nonomuraea sp. NPDC050328]|uniref:primosomal protein N' n=1 Tax=Nonomuraea sp. NPDC050328 TaxID=3364361 RepID=UPI0037BC40E5